MKRILIIAGMLCLASFVSAQQSVEDVLLRVESASKELDAQRRLTAAQKQDAMTGKYLANPTVEMEKLWGASGAGQNTELTVSQAFDFPTVYGARNRIARLKGSLYDSEGAALRQQLLLDAKTLCLEIVYLYRQQDLLAERLSNAERLSEAYQKKLDTGDATSLESNKIGIELIGARTAYNLNRSELQAKLRQLNTMTGGGNDTFEDIVYPEVGTLPAAEQLSELYMNQNPLIESLENSLEIDRRTIALNKGLSLPQFEIGYRHDYGQGRATGFKAGLSIPLFENKNKVKAAKAMAVSSEAQLESARLNASGEFDMLYEQAATLSESMRSMQSALEGQNSLPLLNKALDAGQISVIDYFVEANVLFESRQTLLQIERDFQLAVAQLYRFSL